MRRARAWNCDALIVVNNGAFIGRDAAGGESAPESRAAFATYLDAIDAIMIENVSAETTHPHTIEALDEDFQNNGVPVLGLDVASRFSDTEIGELRQTVLEKARLTGFFHYVASDETFNHLNPPIIFEPQAPAAAG